MPGAWAGRPRSDRGATSPRRAEDATDPAGERTTFLRISLPKGN